MHLQSYLDVNRSQNSIAQAAMAPCSVLDKK
jgi:hypothetical protein